MKIQSSQVNMAANYTRMTEHSVWERLESWRGLDPRDPAPQISAAARACQTQDAQAPQCVGKLVADADLSPDLQLLKNLVEKLTGHQIKLVRPEDVTPSVPPADIPDPQAAP